MSCGCQTYTCPYPEGPIIPPSISTLGDHCCSPLSRPKVLFEGNETGEDLHKIIGVSSCGADVRAPNLREDECLLFEMVLNPCEGMDEFEPIYICCDSCRLAIVCPADTVHLPGPCEGLACTYYRVTYVSPNSGSSTKTYLLPPTTESAKQHSECDCEC